MVDTSPSERPSLIAEGNETNPLLLLPNRAAKEDINTSLEIVFLGLALSTFFAD